MRLRERLKISRTLTRKEIMFRRGKIYAIRDTRSNIAVYIGSTCNQLCKRWGNHKSIVQFGTKCGNGSQTPVHLFMIKEGIWNFNICLLEAFPCQSRAGLRDRERAWVIREKPVFFNPMVFTCAKACNRVPINCECGAIVSKACYRKHLKTAKHQKQISVVKKSQLTPTEDT